MRVTLLLLLLALPAGADSRTIAIDVPAGAEEVADPLRNSGWARRLLSRIEGLEVVVKPGATGDTEILVRPLPVGDEIAGLLNGLPVRLTEGVLVLDGTVYHDDKLALAVRLPRAEKPTWLITGYQVDRLADLAGLVLMKEAGVRLWGRDNEPFDYLLKETAWLERSGVWRTTDTGFAVDRDAERDDLSVRDAYYGGMRTIPGRWIEVRGSAEVAGRVEVRELARRLDAATAEMARRVPVILEQPIRVVIEHDHVAQGRHLGNIGEAVLATDGAVHIVYHPRDDHAYLHRIAQALLERSGITRSTEGRSVGAPPGRLPPWIEDGAALWLSRQWFGRDWQDWLPQLAAARLLPSAEQLLAEEVQEDASAPLWTPVAASLVAALPGDTVRTKLNARGKLRAVPGVPAVKAHLARLRGRTAVRPRGRTAVRPYSERAKPAELPFLRGISFAMLNRIDGGYHAPSIEGQLERFDGLGANAVSLMPFAYQSRPDDPQLKFMNHSPTSETDVGVLYAARRARAAGVKVLWKPHIWVSHDSWPGEIRMADEAAWATWWDSYRRYVAHHAFLAEWAGSELFSIGVELGKTLDRRREWQELIDSVRLLYSGAVTYSGNWHSDYDRAPFWDRLDFIGVDAYFPLAANEHADAAAVADGAREVAELLRQAAERYRKPVILTEVGYAARTGAWVEPHTEGGAFSVEHQAVAYRALLDALGRPPWLRGVFAWKAFSADRGGDADTRADFRFLGRPAEAVLRDYFSPPDPAAMHTSN